MQQNKGLLLQIGNRAHGFDGCGQPQINAGQLEARRLGKSIVPGNDALLHAGGQHGIGAGLGIAGEQHIIIQRGFCLGTAGGKLVGKHGHPLFFAHGGQRQDAVHKLAAARNQRHAACRQFVLGEKRLQRVGQVSLIGDNAVDQAALGQLHLRGGGNARTARRRTAHRRIHRAAAKIQRGKCCHVDLRKN